jgi:hypothetical protein
MNYFSHGRGFLEDPCFLAGTAIPDWMNVVDRKARLRSKQAAPFVDNEDPQLAAVAAGVVQHHHDDDWFHRTRAFMELNLQLLAEIRQLLSADTTMRPRLLAHILVELLLDAALIEEDPPVLDQYYQVMDSVDGQLVQDAFNRMSSRPVSNLSKFIGLFSAERFLYDYTDDGKLLRRLNQVMRRVKLPLLPDETCDLLKTVRPLVRDRKEDLLTADPS